MQKVYSFIKGFSLLLLASCSCGSDHRNGTYTIAADISWYGTDFMGQQNNVTGFSRDLLKEIGKNKKMKLSFLASNADVLLTDLKENRYNGALTALYPYIFNLSTFDFSKPYLLTGPVLVLPVSSTLTALDQLGGKEIAVLAGSNADLVVEKNPGILIRPYDSIPQALNDIIAGAVDGAVVDVIIASSYSQNLFEGQLKIASPPLNEQGLRLIASNSRAQPLINAFNQGLDELKKSGAYETLLKKWSLGQGPLKAASP